MLFNTSSLVAFLAFSFWTVLADVYLHSPRGSNDRLDEQNRERANGNRLFDSQNNNRGGYNVGKMIYYKREKIPIDWTNQHGTSKYQMENSELIFQYMCAPLVRDGTTTRTIPTKPTECYNYDCDTDVRFGRHESLDHYEMCEKTSRNKGLLTINQNLKGEAAKYTRQNNQGTRFAYECPEERDYYPYWRPSPWIDAMIITADEERCAEYQAESQNVKERYECRMPQAFFDAGGKLPNNFYYELNQADCEAQTLEAGEGDDEQEYTAEWKTVPAHGVAAPECVKIGQTRANHLGNPGGRTLYGTTWEIPDTIPAGSQCVGRLRYNITTADYQAWTAAQSLEPGLGAEMNSKKNNPNPGNDPAEYPLWANYGLTRDDVEASFTGNDADSREYVLQNNPQVDAFGALLSGGNTPTNNNNVIKMQLAVNTAQFGRTFQDRTHYWIVEDRPPEIADDAVIKLQTVRGKRGNIVQTYPATEYFMHPETSWTRVGEYVHWEWTGSNTNPNNNDGQGKQGTDRSNMVAQREDQYDVTYYSNFEWDMAYDNNQRDDGSAGVSYPGYVKEPEGYEIPDIYKPELNTEAFGGMSQEVLMMLATTRATPHDMGNMEELDDAGTSFNLVPQRMNKVGCTNYLCTRNNNFSNRAQKGKMCIAEGDVGEVMVPTSGAEWWDTRGTSSVKFWPGAVAGMERAHVIMHYTDNAAEISITDANIIGTMTITTAYTPASMQKAKLMYLPECNTRRGDECGDNTEWESVDFEAMQMNGASVAQADVTKTGTYKVVYTPNPGPILALTVGLLAFVGALFWVLLNKCGDRCPARLQRFQMSKSKIAAMNGNTTIQTTSGPPPFKGTDLRGNYA